MTIKQQEFKVRIPATTANLGSGMDTLSLAIKLYLTINVKVILKQQQNSNSSTTRNLFNIKYTSDKLYNIDSIIPLDENQNFITCTIMSLFKEFKIVLDSIDSIDLDIVNDVPIGRGMGSSATSIAAAILIVNRIADLGLSNDQMFQISKKFDPSCDNLSASIFGGFTICLKSSSNTNTNTNTNTNNYVMVRKININPKTKFKAVVVIPFFQILTEVARKVLPPSYSLQDVVFNLQRVSVLSSLLQQGLTMDDSSTDGNNSEDVFNQKLSVESMNDKIHQPFRATLFPGFNDIQQTLLSSPPPGLFGFALSGSGPTLFAITYDHHSVIGELISSLLIKHSQLNSEYYVLDFENHGAHYL
eukprot:gene3608-4492_t